MSDINDAIEEFIDGLFEARGVITTDNFREQLEEERVVLEGELPDFDDLVRGDQIEGFVTQYDIDYTVENSSPTGLDEDGIVDLMRSYHPGGCRTARAANDMLGSWLEGVLSGELDEQADRLNEHIRAVVAAALLPQEPHIEERIVEVQVEAGEQWFVIERQGGVIVAQPPFGPFASAEEASQFMASTNRHMSLIFQATDPLAVPSWANLVERTNATV